MRKFFKSGKLTQKVLQNHTPIWNAVLLRCNHSPNLFFHLSRLKYHRENCVPIIEYYEKKGIVIHINGNQSKEAVQDEVKSKLDPLFYPPTPIGQKASE